MALSPSLLAVALALVAVATADQPQVSTIDGNVHVLVENGKDIVFKRGSAVDSVSALSASVTDAASRIGTLETGQTNLETRLTNDVDNLFVTGGRVQSLDDAVNSRVGALETSTDSKFGEIDGRLDGIDTDKADKTDMNTKLGLKADLADVNSQLADKADQVYVDTLAKTTDVTAALALKADESSVVSRLADKVDTTTFDDELAAKADQSGVDAALALKVDAGTMTAQLGLKVDTATFNSAMDAKVDKATMTLLLADKASNNDVDEKADESETQLKLDAKADKVFVVEQLALKSTVAETDLRAKQSFVVAELLKKADVTYVNTELNKKALQTTVDALTTQLTALTAGQSDLDAAHEVTRGQALTLQTELDDLTSSTNTRIQTLTADLDTQSSTLTIAIGAAKDAAVALAKSYTDKEISTLNTDLRTFATSQATTKSSAALQDAKVYSDASESDANAYTDARVGETLASANGFTTSAVASQATTTLADAKTYASDQATTKAALAETNARSYTDNNIAALIDTQAALNGTMQSTVDLLNDGVVINQENIAALTTRVVQLELADFPKTCRDVLRQTADTHTRSSQVYTLYPAGELGPTVQRYCELHLQATASPNIALKQPAEQTTTSNDAPASRIVDGRLFATAWVQNSCNHGDTETNPWWAVDLGKTTIVDHVVVSPRSDSCCTSRSNQFEIRLAPASWTTDKRPNQYPECTPGVRHNPKFPNTIECTNVVEARYVIFYLPGSNRQLNFCELEVYEAGTDMSDAGGWTLIASTDGSPLANELRTYYTNDAVLPGQNALLKPYFTQNIKELGNELLVINAHGDKHVFKLHSIEGEVVFDGPNRVVAAESQHVGFIYGNNRPVSNRYQVGKTCTSADCNVAANARANADFSIGMLVVFDWDIDTGDADASIYNHAHLGGTAYLGRNWATPCTRVYIR